LRRRITTGPRRGGQEQTQRKRASAHRPGSQQITEAANGLNDLDAELLADTADKHLDGIGIAVEVLVVEMLDKFGTRHHAPEWCIR